MKSLIEFLPRVNFATGQFRYSLKLPPVGTASHRLVFSSILTLGLSHRLCETQRWPNRGNSHFHGLHSHSQNSQLFGNIAKFPNKFPFPFPLIPMGILPFPWDSQIPKNSQLSKKNLMINFSPVIKLLLTRCESHLRYCLVKNCLKQLYTVYIGSAQVRAYFKAISNEEQWDNCWRGTVDNLRYYNLIQYFLEIGRDR